MRAPSVATLALAAWSTGGCPANTPAARTSAESAPCTAAAGTLPADVRAETLTGEYRLTLVATSGPRGGESASGTMRLVRYTADNPRDRPAAGQPGANARYPIYGSADISLAAVGAVAFGDIASTDAARPGVLGIQWTSGEPSAQKPEITLRFGSEANRADLVPFDGTHMALFIGALSAGGFSGSWRSGDGTRTAGGYFCAERAAAGQ